MRRLLLLACCASLALTAMGCGSDSTDSDSDGATITVTATRDGQPFSDALVVVSTSANPDSVVAMGMTGADGVCILSDLEPGTYIITVSHGAEGQLVFGQVTEIEVSSGGESVRAIVADQVLDDLMPLALNNRWDMVSGDDPVASIGVFSTKTIHGVLTYAFGPEEGGYPGYFTRSGSIVYDHGYEMSTGGDFIRPHPVVWVDFLASIGTVWTIPNWGSTEMLEKGITVTVPAGTFTNCVHVRMSGTVEGGFWAAPGVGMVRFDRNGVVSELTDYELH